MQLRELLCVPDLAARVWPAERVLLGLRVDRQIRALLRECALAVCYHASDVCTAEQLQLANFSLFWAVRSRGEGGEERTQPDAHVKLRSLRGDTARVCAIAAALARALASGWEGPATLEISGARACGRRERELEAAVVQGTLGKCARLVKLLLESISFDITPQGVQLASALVACTRLQELRLSGCRFEEQASPAAFFSSIAQATPGMRVLSLSNCTAASGLGMAVSASVPHWSLLTHLRLSVCGLSDTDITSLASTLHKCHFLRLQSVDLASNSFTNPLPVVKALASRCGHTLRTLDISENRLSLRPSPGGGGGGGGEGGGGGGGGGGGRLAEGLRGLGGLTCLNLSDCLRAEESSADMQADGALSGLISEGGLSALTNLALRRNSIGAQGAQAFAVAFKSCPLLQSLDLGVNCIGPKGCDALAHAAALGSMTSLTHIDLSHNGLGDLGATNLSHALHYFAKLRGLELDSNEIDASGAEALGRSLGQGKLSESLQLLALAGNTLGDSGLKLLLCPPLLCCTTLKVLDVSGNDIGDIGMAFLCSTVWGRWGGALPSLQVLDFGGNLVSDLGAMHLAKSLRTSANLRLVNLCGNNIAIAGQQALATAKRHVPDRSLDIDIRQQNPVQGVPVQGDPRVPMSQPMGPPQGAAGHSQTEDAP